MARLTPGWAFRTSARTMTETDPATFVSASGFVEPLFLDARHGQVEGSSGRLVPAALTLGLAEGLVVQSRAFHGTALALFSIALDIRAPLRTGDTIAVAVEVADTGVPHLRWGSGQGGHHKQRHRSGQPHRHGVPPRPAPRVRPTRKSTSRR